MNWIYKPSNIKKLIYTSIVVLVLLVLLELFIDIKIYFKTIDYFSFNSVYGFLSCVIMVAFAKFLGFFIKRNEDYYDDE